MADYSAGLGHVQLEVADLERSVAFYTRFLGLRVTERVESRKGRIVFLSAGDRHHELALRAAPGGGGDGRGGDAGDEAADPAAGTAFSAPFQVAFELPDRQAFDDLFFELRKAGVPTTAVDHGIAWAVYFRDPDGTAVEAYWDVRATEGGRGRWGGRSQLLAVSQILPEERVEELAERREAEEEQAEPASRDDEEGADDPAGEGAGPDPATGDRSGTSD